MVAKELIEGRWRFIIGALLTLLIAVLLGASYDFVRGILGAANTSALPAAFRQQILQGLGNYDAYTWAQWFGKNGQMILGALAAFLGGGLLAGEVSKGTIYFLLSKPVSRERVLLTKYLVTAAAFLGITALGSVGIIVTGAAYGHPQPLGAVLGSTLLLWLGTLSVLGVALLCSAIFDDSLRPVGLALVFGVLIGLPAFVGAFVAGWTDWSLTTYWASQSYYLGGAFPAREFAVSLVAAALPLLLAWQVFRRRAY
jgi:ABC-2 type transport system permease protein